MRVLLVKMSSLGDVVHTLPAVTEAAAHGARFDWVVEEAFAAIAARHPAVAKVLPIGWRRWRRRLLRERGALRAFFEGLRAERYDLILDAQGLWKSAVVAAAARGPSAGLDRASAREGTASWLYARRATVPAGQHAVDRLRQLFGQHLGYAPAGTDDFGIARMAGSGQPCAMLCHGTSWDSKLWPERFWLELAAGLSARGLRVLVPAGSEAERDRAGRLAAAGHAEALPPQPLEALIDQLSGCALTVGVDSGLSHLAGALGVPTVGLYGSTATALTGVRGPKVVNLAADFACAPCRSRRCSYAGPPVHVDGEPVVPACFGTLTPTRVLGAVDELAPCT